MKWYQDEKGDISAGRIMSMYAVVTGCLVIVLSTIALFLKVDGSITMGGIGLGLATAGLGGKALSKKIEVVK